MTFLVFETVIMFTRQHFAVSTLPWTSADWIEDWIIMTAYGRSVAKIRG